MDVVAASVLDVEREVAATHVELSVVHLIDSLLVGANKGVVEELTEDASLADHRGPQYQDAVLQLTLALAGGGTRAAALNAVLS